MSGGAGATSLFTSMLVYISLLLSKTLTSPPPRQQLPWKVQDGEKKKLWENTHLLLSWANVDTHFSLREKCWVTGGVGGKFPRL